MRFEDSLKREVDWHVCLSVRKVENPIQVSACVRASGGVVHRADQKIVAFVERHRRTLPLQSWKWREEFIRHLAEEAGTNIRGRQ